MHVLAISAALAITPASIVGVITTLVGWYLKERVREVHVLVDGRLTAALTEIQNLEAAVAALQVRALAAAPLPPHE